MVSAHASGNESSDEEAVIGNSWQRSELTGVNDQSPAEKLSWTDKPLSQIIPPE